MPERRRYVNVDELMPQICVEEALSFYGADPGAVHQVGCEIRMRCVLNCGKTEETGDRAVAINTDDPVKKWKCHQYGCGRGGNLIGLCNLLKSGYDGGPVQPRGSRFRQIAADLQAMAGVNNESGSDRQQPANANSKPSKKEKPKVNRPLKESENERARALVNLDEKFVVDVAEMNPHAAQYFRRRPFLTPEMCRKWRCGYLPRDAGGDRTGGTMRGKIVYPILAETGEILTWFGRDPQYEEKHRKWTALGKEGKEPAKFHLVKNFHRGLELFGQHRLQETSVRELIAELGLIVVEGPNDVIALDALGVPAMGLCSNTITREQTAKVTRIANEVGDETVTLMLDCDAEGENGGRQALWEIAQHCRVRLAWSSTMHGGKFRGRQPESLTADEWGKIRAVLHGGNDQCSKN